MMMRSLGPVNSISGCCLRAAPRALLPTPRPAAARRSRRLCPSVTAFKPAYFPPARTDGDAAAAPRDASPAAQHSGPTVSLPLDYYACLGLSRASGSHAVREALDSALSQPPDVGYTADTLSVRSVLLRNAADCLLDLRTRKGYDAMGSSLGGYTVDVSTQYLPGALVLLQESGLNALVVELGARWLAGNRQDRLLSRDVAACMALAHHELAAAALQRDGTRVSAACQHLERALLLLRQARRSPEAGRAAQLQQEIMQQLEECSPQYCLELLALPLRDPQRERGRLLLRKLVFDVAPDVSPLGRDRDAFLQCARGCLTAQEYLALYKGVPSSDRSLEQQLDVALASVAVAFLERRPLLMQHAAQAYCQLEGLLGPEGRGDEGSSSNSSGGADLSVCRASCALLLGDTPEAVQLLGLADAPDRQPQEGVREYVMAHCNDSSDLLPGVYALAQCWMREAVLGSFRPASDAGGPHGGDQQQQQPAALAAWFGAWHVRLFITVLAVLARLQQWVAAAARLEHLRALPAAAAACLVWLQQSVRVQQRKQQQQPPLGPPSGSSTARARAAVSADAAGSTRAGPAGASPGHERDELRRPELQPQAGTSAAPVQPPVAAASTRAAGTRRSRSPVLQRLEPAPPPPSEERGELPAGAPSPQPPAAFAAAPAAGVAARLERGGAFAGAPGRPAGAGLAAAPDAGGSMDEGGELPDEEDAAPDQATAAARARLSAQLRSLDAQMWDPVSPPSGMPAAVVLGVVLVAAAAVWGIITTGGGKKGCQPVGFKARVQTLREARA